MTISRIVLVLIGVAGLAAAQNTNTINFRADGVGDCPAASWAFDAAQVPIASGVGTRGQIRAFTVNRQLDQCSPRLFEASLSGNRIASVVLTQYDSTGRIPVVTITLNDVFVSNYQVGGSTGSPLPGESVALTFGSIKIEYRSLNGGGSVEAGWDFRRNARM